MRIFFFLILISYTATVSAQKEKWRSKTEKAAFIHRAVKEITDVMVYDIYSPPVASRTYAYISVAGYEAISPAYTNYVSLAGQLHGLTPPPKPDGSKEYSYTLAAVQAILTTGKNFVISEEQIEAFTKQILNDFKSTGIPDEVMKNSVEYGNAVAAHVLAWAATDHYKEVRAMPRYAVREDESSWKPTPPAYMKAVEPNWNKMRTFVIDSAEQFKPVPPTPFSKDSTSLFYKEALAVHDAGTEQTAEQNEIANFWDCNPFKVNVKGHVMFATKKISPNGHWENITRLVCNKAGADAMKTAEAYACVSVAMADCFISCWDEKYRSNVIRPETYINNFIDENWVPTLQTPPFPEYTSGHSVVSAAAAVILTKLFGENVSFADSTENEFSLPVRSYTSFTQASREAAISRFYGGIHYLSSINNGIAEGENIGRFVADKLRIKKNEVAKK